MWIKPKLDVNIANKVYPVTGEQPGDLNSPDDQLMQSVILDFGNIFNDENFFCLVIHWGIFLLKGTNFIVLFSDVPKLEKVVLRMF